MNFPLPHRSFWSEKIFVNIEDVQPLKMGWLLVLFRQTPKMQRISALNKEEDWRSAFNDNLKES